MRLLFWVYFFDGRSIFRPLTLISVDRAWCGVRWKHGALWMKCPELWLVRETRTLASDWSSLTLDNNTCVDCTWLVEGSGRRLRKNMPSVFSDQAKWYHHHHGWSTGVADTHGVTNEPWWGSEADWHHLQCLLPHIRNIQQLALPVRRGNHRRHHPLWWAFSFWSCQTLK